MIAELLIGGSQASGRRGYSCSVPTPLEASACLRGSYPPSDSFARDQWRQTAIVGWRVPHPATRMADRNQPPDAESPSHLRGRPLVWTFVPSLPELIGKRLNSLPSL